MKVNNKKKKNISQLEFCREILKEKSLSRVDRLLSNIKSDAFLTYIVLKSNKNSVRKMAFDRICNQRFYWLILRNIDSKNERNNIISKITDKNVLAQIAIFEPDAFVAIKSLSILGEKKIIALLACYGLESERIEAINFVDDKEALEKILKFEGQYDSVKDIACQKIKRGSAN